MINSDFFMDRQSASKRAADPALPMGDLRLRHSVETTILIWGQSLNLGKKPLVIPGVWEIGAGTA
jgi:hypothetical protein